MTCVDAGRIEGADTPLSISYCLEAKNFTSALVKGDPEEGGVIKQSVKELVRGIFPHKG